MSGVVFTLYVVMFLVVGVVFFMPAQPVEEVDDHADHW